MTTPRHHFRSLATVVVALLFCSAAVHADLVWEKREIRLQATPMETEVEAHYPFKNQGTETVKIRSVQANCSCVSTTVSRMEIPPGGDGEVTVKFRPGHRVGEQIRPVLISFDDAKNSRTMIALRVEIPDVIRARPPYVKWDAGEKMELKSVAILTNQNYPVKSLRVVPSANALEASVKPIEGSPNYTLELLPQRGSAPESYEIFVEATLLDGQVKRTQVIVAVR